MSLGSWFRDYVYFPLGGSRVKSKLRLVFNLAVVWFATGIWHGANWTFILWGVLYGVILIVEKLFNLPKVLPKKKAASFVYQVFTLLAVMLGWVLFRADNLGVAVNYIRTMFGMNGAALIDDAAIFNFREYIIPLAAGIICCTPVFKLLRTKMTEKGGALANIWEMGAGIWQLLLFLAGISYLVINAHNPFIYFNF